MWVYDGDILSVIFDNLLVVSRGGDYGKNNNVSYPVSLKL
jgi:hypothetical protein